MIECPNPEKPLCIRREVVNSPMWPVRWRIWVYGIYYEYAETWRDAFMWGSQFVGLKKNGHIE